LYSGLQFIIRNPSDAFAGSTAEVRSLSPLTDFIDAVPCERVDFASLVSTGEVRLLDGLIYTKEDEVFTPTALRVLTASNIDIKTASLVRERFRYLRDDFPIQGVLRAEVGDILVSKASGSLGQLGKCCEIQEAFHDIVGGFLFVIRCKKKELAKAIFYRLLSLPFRQFVVGFKDQNINNLSPGGLARFNWSLPKDLKGFLATATQKEKHWQEARERLAALAR
jgi:hypothetical protein